MAYYVKDDTLNQQNVEYKVDLQIQHSGNAGKGLKAVDARLYEPLKNYSENNLDRMYTPVFTIDDNHPRKQGDNPYITYDLTWPANIGTGDRILSLEACETEEGPWTEVARIDATNEPLSWTETRVTLKLDAKNRGFGSGSGDTGGASKHGVIANRNDITGYVQIGTYYPRSWKSQSFNTTGMDTLSFYYIIGNDKNGLEYTDMTREKYIMSLVRKSDGHVMQTQFFDGRQDSWTLFNMNVRNTNGNCYIQIVQPKHSGGKYDGAGFCFFKGTSTITHYKSGDTTANFYFNQGGEYQGVEVIGDGRPYVSGDNIGRGSNKRFFRFSVISKNGHNVVRDVKPNNSTGTLLSPLGNDRTKWWVPKEIYAKDSGAWKEIREVYVKNNNNWDKVYPLFINSENFVSISDIQVKQKKDYIPLSAVYVDNATTITSSSILPNPVILIAGASSDATPTFTMTPSLESGQLSGTNFKWGYSLYNRGEKLPKWKLDQNDTGSYNNGFMLALEVDGPNMNDLNQVGVGVQDVGFSANLQSGIKDNDLIVAIQRFSNPAGRTETEYNSSRPAGWSLQSFSGLMGARNGFVVYTKIASKSDSGKVYNFPQHTNDSSEIFTIVFRDTNNIPIKTVAKAGFKQKTSSANPQAFTLAWSGMNLNRTGSASVDATANTKRTLPPLSPGVVRYHVWGWWGDSKLLGGYGYYRGGRPATVKYIESQMDTPENIGNYYVSMYHGYIVPHVSGTYKFQTYSDDGSYLWLGDHAKFKSTRTRANAQVDNGGLHSPRFASQEYSKYLTAGQRYPVFANMYERRGRDVLRVFVKSPNHSNDWQLKNSDFSWMHDPNEDFSFGTKYFNG